MMSCYHPLIAYPEGRTESGKWRYIPRGLWSPDLMKDSHLDFRHLPVSVDGEEGFGPVPVDGKPDPIKIPCKKCIGCRLDYARSWADRMILELDHFKGKAIFLTLTYNDEHLKKSESGFSTLCRRDLQLFMKRLRRALPDREIRFYACGEYGSWSKTHRPHIHIILYGLSMDEFPFKRLVARNELGQLSYSDKFLEHIWTEVSKVEFPLLGPMKSGKPLSKKVKVNVYDAIGHIAFSEVSWKTCAYVARYVQKKVFSGDESLIEQAGIEPEFSLMSRNPGIAGYYFLDHPEMIGCTKFASGDPDHPIQLMPYLIDKLEGFDYDLVEEIKYQRKHAAEDKFFLEMLNTDKEPLEYLSDKEKRHLSKVSQLKRNL